MIDASAVVHVQVPVPEWSDRCDQISVNCHHCGFVGMMWTDREIDPTREPCIFCN